MIGKSLNEKFFRLTREERHRAKVERRVEQVLGGADVPDELRRAVTEIVEAGSDGPPPIVWDSSKIPRDKYGR